MTHKTTCAVDAATQALNRPAATARASRPAKPSRLLPQSNGRRRMTLRYTPEHQLGFCTLLYTHTSQLGVWTWRIVRFRGPGPACAGGA
eukprot:2436148-Rhodomonas_salina.1